MQANQAVPISRTRLSLSSMPQCLSVSFSSPTAHYFIISLCIPRETCVAPSQQNNQLQCPPGGERLTHFLLSFLFFPPVFSSFFPIPPLFKNGSDSGVYVCRCVIGCRSPLASFAGLGPARALYQGHWRSSHRPSSTADRTLRDGDWLQMSADLKHIERQVG